MNGAAWRVTLAATALMALAMGLRSSGGLFVSPLNSATGLGLATLSLLFAGGQLALGLAQPVVGHWADRVGGARVVTLGAVVMAGAMALLSLPAWLTLAAAPAAMTLALALAGTMWAALPASGSAVGRPKSRAPTSRCGWSISAWRWRP